jgi:hypothetical protein
VSRGNGHKGKTLAQVGTPFQRPRNSNSHALQSPDSIPISPTSTPPLPSPSRPPQPDAPSPSTSLPLSLSRRTPMAMASREGASTPRPPRGEIAPPTALTRLPLSPRAGDTWSEIVASGGLRPPHIGVVYGRRRVEESSSRRNVEM